MTIAEQSVEVDLAEQDSTIAHTACCIVGAGPGGAMLSYLLARKGIDVILLELHDDFDRDFRGDTVHPSVMEIMDQLGLADDVLKIPHSKVSRITFTTAEGPITIGELSKLKTKFPYIALIPQTRFLEFLTERAKQFADFNLVMNANVQELIQRNGVVQGVRYTRGGRWHTVKSLLTVAADGRSSRVRRLAGLEPKRMSPPIDVLWFRVSRRPSDGSGVTARFGNGHIIIMLDRNDLWQIAYIIPKGSFQEVRAAGIENFKSRVAELAPQIADRMSELDDWKNISMLSVESSRLKKWYLPGLLFIGDAAHVMSPVGGVGINYAVQDAVVAANVLTQPLREGHVEIRHLAEVQRQREWPTRIIQTFQAIAQGFVVKAALNPKKTFKPPFVLKIPLFRRLLARVIAFGVKRVRVED